MCMYDPGFEHFDDFVGGITRSDRRDEVEVEM
jgi:hypothetical protein